MNIYKMNINQIRTEIKKFGRTAYGKTVFTIAYALPLFLTIITLVLSIASFICFSCCDSMIISLMLPIIAFIDLITFIMGSKYYYTELRLFVKEEKKKLFS